MKYHSNNIKTNSNIKNEIAAYLNNLITEKISIKKYDSITIAGIGSDRCIGDSLGPFVGTFLEEKKWRNVNIIGNFENPLHAKNLKERIELISDNSLVIAIDACLGLSESIGCINIKNGPLHPGVGVNKELPPVGDISITGNVNLSGNLEFIVLQNTRLYTVIELAKSITNILSEVIPFINLNVGAEEIREEIIA